MSKSVQAKVEEQLAREPHHLRDQKIRKIRAAMEVQLYVSEKVTTSKRRQFQVCLNNARHAATTWSDSGRPRAIEQLEREIHQVTPAKHKLFDKLFQLREQQQLQEVETKATGLRSIFGKKLAQMKTVAEDQAYGTVNITADKRVQLQVYLSDAEIETSMGRIADTDRIVNHLDREIYGITSKDQMRFTKQFSICLVEFEGWWQGIGFQEIRKTMEQDVIHYENRMMHLVSHISQSIQRMGSGGNFTTDISEWLHIGNVKEAYRSTIKVNYIPLMLKHNDWCTDFDYMEETLSYVALQG
jgi:hypothetical protein